MNNIRKAGWEPRVLQIPLTPYGNKPMVTPIVNAVNYHYGSFEVLRQITDGEIDGYTYHRDDNPTVRAVERKIDLHPVGVAEVQACDGVGFLELRKMRKIFFLAARVERIVSGNG